MLIKAFLKMIKNCRAITSESQVITHRAPDFREDLSQNYLKLKGITMITDVKYKIGILVVLFLCISWTFVAIYGITQICTRPSQLNLIESQKIQIETLKLKIQELQNVNNTSLILE